MKQSPTNSLRTIEPRGMIPNEKIGWYKEVFQKIIDTLKPAKTWRIAYSDFASVWNTTTEGMLLPLTTKGRNSVFATYGIFPLSQDALEEKLGGIKLQVAPAEDESEDDIGLNAKDRNPPDRIWVDMTSAETQAAVHNTLSQITPTEMTEESRRLYFEFEEHFLAGFDVRGNGYLPTEKEVILDTKHRRVSITQAYRIRMKQIFKNENLRERILEAIISF